MLDRPRMTDPLRERVALVTGASAGIGAAVARSLAAAGMKVAICARRRDRLEVLANAIAATGATTPLVRTCNMRVERDILTVFEAVREAWGGVDVLVNNAGLGRAAPLCTGDTEAWREILEVNVLGLCIATREAVTDMTARGDRGHVVHISSMASHRVPTGSGVYSASKFAVRSLTEGLRRELRERKSSIRVTAISPGFVETEFAAVYHGDADAAAATYRRYPCLQPDDIASAVLYAVSQPSHVQVHDVLVRPTQQPD
jgi:NADP-dependent 3-hydroxy acid dehydrogenase YdfG